MVCDVVSHSNTFVYKINESFPVTHKNKRKEMTTNTY